MQHIPRWYSYAQAGKLVRILPSNSYVLQEVERMDKLLKDRPRPLPQLILTPEETPKAFKELTNFLTCITLVICLGSIQCGFNLWLVHDPSTLREHIQKLTEEDEVKRAKHSVLLIFTVASYLLGCLFGTLFFGPLADKCGRKGVLLFNDLFSIISTTILAVSQSLRIHEVSSLGRLFTGISTGIFSCAVPMYLGEIAPKNIRGGICALPMMFISLGMFMSQVLGGPEVLGTKKEMPFLLSIPGILALFQLFLLLPFPESPRYLMIQKRDEEGARRVLQRLRDRSDVEDEIEELRQEDLYEKEEKKMTILKLLHCVRLRWQLVCVVTLFVTQQFTGVNAAYYYADRVFLVMEVEENNVRYSSAMLTFLGLFIHGLSVYLMDSWGRRPLLLIGFSICIISCILLTVSLEIQFIIPWMGNISSFLLLVFLVGIILGPNSIPFLMITELFLQSSRASAFAVGGFLQWFLVLFVGFLFIFIEERIKTYSFLILLPFSAIGFVYILKCVPETKKKTFLDIRKFLEKYLENKRLQKVQPEA